MLARVDLPFRRAYHPIGFQLQLATNSDDVLEAARECWSSYELEFTSEPIEMRVVVGAEGRLARRPSFRLYRHLMSIVSDACNSAAVDLGALFACIYVSRETAANHTAFRWFFLESIAYTLLAQRYVAPLHAATIARNRTGILLCGASGAGKSTLAFAAACAGWTFLSDDCTWLLADSSDATAIGKPHQVRFREDAPNLFPRLAAYAARERPNGKIGIELPMQAFPELPTALHCRLGAMVWLDRRRGVRPSIEPVEPVEAVRQMLNSSSYGKEVDMMHAKAAQRLLYLPACRLQYDALDDGLTLLSEFGETVGARAVGGAA